MAYKVLSREEANYIDKFAVKNKIISNEKLMDNAGKLSAQFFLEKINNPFNKSVLILAGKGNNGGDAIIMYHYLKKYGVNADLYIFDYSVSKFILSKYNISQNEILFKSDPNILKSYDWYVDGIFGIGLNRPITGNYKNVIGKIRNKNIISLDIPSGVDCNTGKNICETFIEPKYVLSMGNYKYSDVINLGKKNFLNTKVLDIGLPDSDSYSSKLIELSDIKKIIKPDNLYRNKYDQECSAILGSKKFSGAANLSIKSALVSGAGYLKTYVPYNINTIIHDNHGAVNNFIGKGDYLKKSDLQEILKLDFIKKKSPVLIGPGLGNKRTTSKLIQELLSLIELHNSECVLDASGFEPIYNGMSIRDLPKKCILTPHMGELKKIFPLSNTNNMVDLCKSLIPVLDSRVLLIKGPVNIIISSQKEILFLNNGLSSLATAGSGDILSGMILAFLSKGYEIDNSTILATYLHGLCSQIFSKKGSKYSMCPNQIIKSIPSALNELCL